jgi:hypothetical protein
LEASDFVGADAHLIPSESKPEQGNRLILDRKCRDDETFRDFFTSSNGIKTQPAVLIFSYAWKRQQTI